jgi:hypothetical protein
MFCDVADVAPVVSYKFSDVSEAHIASSFGVEGIYEYM